MRELIQVSRALRRSPAFLAATVLTLGLGLGAPTAIFAVIRAVLLAPVVVDEDRVVRVWKQDVHRGGDAHPLSYAEFLEWRDSTQTFQALAAINYTNAYQIVVAIGDQPVPVSMAPVSTGFFAVVDGGPPLAGRWLEAGDDAPGADLAAVISERFWRRIANGDPAFVGRRLNLFGSERTVVVVGVASERLNYPLGSDVWIPIAALSRAGMLHSTIENRRYWQFDLIGRLAPGVSLDDALAELNTVNRRVTAEYPADYRPMPVTAVPVHQTVVGEARDILLFLLAAAALVFITAGMNAAALLSMRASERERDLLVRLALGAGRARLFRQSFTEATALSGLSTALGVATAFGAVRLVVSLAPADIPRIERSTVDTATLAFGVALAVAWTFALAATLTWRAVRAGERSVTDRGAFTRAVRQPVSLNVLAAAEIAVAVVVSIAAGLLLKSFVHLSTVDRGFDDRNLAMIAVQLPTNYSTLEARVAFHETLVERLSSIPGVAAATPTQNGPFTGGGLAAGFLFEGQTSDDHKTNPWTAFEGVLPSFFRTLGIPVVRGRAFTDADRKGAQRVAMVSESVAQRHWPGQDPIGKRLKFDPDDDAWSTVVGVAADTRYRDMRNAGSWVYFPARQLFYFEPAIIAVRATDPEQVIPLVRRRIAEQDSRVAILMATTMQTIVGGAMSRPRAALVVAAAFALLAVLLAVIGVYGVIAFSVALRTRELAVRSALGASPRQLVAVVLGHSAGLGAVGCAAGLAIAWATTRGLSAMLFEVRPLDPSTFAAVVTGLLVLVVGAAAIPATHAACVSPAEALRRE